LVKSHYTFLVIVPQPDKQDFFSDPPAEFKDGVNLVKKALDDTVKSIIGMTTSSKILRKSYLL